MRLSRLSKTDREGIVERFYYRKYSGSSHFGISLMRIIDDDVEFTLKNKKAIRGIGYNLNEMLIEQINIEKEKNNCHYDTYKHKLN